MPFSIFFILHPCACDILFLFLRDQPCALTYKVPTTFHTEKEQRRSSGRGRLAGKGRHGRKHRGGGGNGRPQQRRWRPFAHPPGTAARGATAAATSEAQQLGRERPRSQAQYSRCGGCVMGVKSYLYASVYLLRRNVLYRK